MLPNPSHYTVYHGTNLFSAKVIRYNGILLEAQRELTDFGQGFYVTPNRKQAIEWAHVKAKNRQVNPTMLEMLGLNKKEYLQNPDTRTPAYLTYNINVSRLLVLNGLIFPMPYEPLWLNYKEIWKSFVQHSRMGVKHQYDFVYGPIGSSHNGSYFQVTPSKLKVQLSLNSVKALQSLSNLSITTLTPKKLKARHLKNTEHRSSGKNSMNHRFIKDIRDEVIVINQCSEQHATKLVEGSWVAAQIQKQNSILFHESPAFWAFFILFGDKKLWYKHYETYMKKRNLNI